MRLRLILLLMLGLLMLSGCPADDAEDAPEYGEDIAWLDQPDEHDPMVAPEADADIAWDEAGEELRDALTIDQDRDPAIDQPEVERPVDPDTPHVETQDIRTGQVNTDDDTRSGFSDLVLGMERHLNALNRRMGADLDASFTSDAPDREQVIANWRSEMETTAPTYTIMDFTIVDADTEEATANAVLQVEGAEVPTERRQVNYTFRLEDGAWRIHSAETSGAERIGGGM